MGMVKRIALNVSLTPELAKYVTALVASGRYGTVSEVMRVGLRLLQEKETVSSLHGPVQNADEETALV